MRDISLVTGGAGFIGSHLVEALAARGQRVRIFDDFSTGLESNLKDIDPKPQIIKGDIADPEAVGQAVEGASLIYHLAALPSVQRSLENPSVSHAACATGTLHVLDAARRNRVRRVVYAASSSAYGGLSSRSGQKEEAGSLPLSPYAAAKLTGELYCQAFSGSYGLETVRLRFFNIFGPRQRADSPYSGVIAVFIAAMLRGEAPAVHGDGLQSRDFTYVSNAVQALVRAASTDDISGNVYNVGTGRSISVLDLVSALSRLLGKNLKPRQTSLRAGDVRFSLADITLSRKELGYEPDIGFEEGLEKTIAWYRQTQLARP
jgi:UDP-glucose 4-epimerase